MLVGYVNFIRGSRGLASDWPEACAAGAAMRHVRHAGDGLEAGGRFLLRPLRRADGADRPRLTCLPPTCATKTKRRTSRARPYRPALRPAITPYAAVMLSEQNTNPPISTMIGISRCDVRATRLTRQ